MLKNHKSQKVFLDITRLMSSFSSYSASLSDEVYGCVPTWEESVCRDGSLFYVQYYNENANENTKSASGSNKTLRQICKCNDIKHTLACRSTHTLHKKQYETVVNLNNKYFESIIGKSQYIFQKFSGKEIEVHLLISPDNQTFCRENICESLLGFSTRTFSDGIRLKVDEYIKNSLLYKKKCIKIGDWFKSINEFEINSLNIEKVLLQFTKPTNVYLRFERILEDKTNLDVNKINQISTVENFVNLAECTSKSNQESNNETEIRFSAMVLPISFLCDENISNDQVFCYPESKENNIFNIRGSFLTLFSILKTQLTVEPIDTKINIGGIDFFVSYFCHINILLLVAISSNCLTAKEAELKILDIVQYFQMCYQIFDKTIDSETKTHMHHLCRIIDKYLQNVKNIYLFEEILEQSHSIELPKNTQQEIFETLNEMGAMDYRDWNDTPLNAHREFFIYGCALYFQSYLLNNQLLPNHLSKVESFLRCSGVFNFVKNHKVRDFIYWKEVPLDNTTRRSFLLIYTRNYLTLAVLLQEHDSEQLLNSNIIYGEKIQGPPLFYIEEIQDTLNHLRQGGVEYLAKFLITRCKRPDIDIFGEHSLPSCDTSILINSIDDASLILKKNCLSNVTNFEASKSYESDSDWDGVSKNNYKCRKRTSSGPVIKVNLSDEISDNIPVSICNGDKNILIHYVQINFGSGLIIAPPNELSGVLIQEFKSACHLIHLVFQKTKRLKKFLSKSKTSESSCKSLALVGEHAILIQVPYKNAVNQQFWAIGKLFKSPISELYVCYKSETPPNLEEISYRLSYATSG